MIHMLDKVICHDCACEYRKIFFDYKNREARKKPISKDNSCDLYISEDGGKTVKPFKFNKIKRIDDGISEDS